MTGGLVRTDDAIMWAKESGPSDSNQFAPTSRELNGYWRSIAKYQTHRNRLVRSPIPRTPQNNGPPTATIASATMCASPINGSSGDLSF
jgi:hypothetical protein